MAFPRLYKHNDIPTKAKVGGAVEFLEAKNIEHTKADVFRHFGVSHRQDWAMISEGSVDRRHHNREDLDEEMRGTKRVISHEHIREMGPHYTRRRICCPCDDLGRSGV